MIGVGHEVGDLDDLTGVSGSDAVQGLEGLRCV